MTAKSRLTIELPDEERGVSEYHIARFDKINRKLARPDLKQTERDDLLEERVNLEVSPRMQRELDAIQRGIDESVALAKARGEEVRQSKHGPRIVSRGGLTHAYEDGHLEQDRGSTTDHDLYCAGKRYRDLFEIAEGMTSGGEGGGGFGPKAPQVRVAEAGAELLFLRGKITKRQIDVLDLVCGKDMRIRAAATELKRGFPSTKNALRAGLKVLVGLKFEGGTKIRMDMTAVGSAIEKAQNRL